MILSDKQKDAVTELINIAFSRAAASLSDLTNHRVLLEAPSVSIHIIGDLEKALDGFVQGEIATVHQIFGGPVTGDAMLLLNYDGAVALSNLLTGGSGKGDRLYQSDREVLTEVGNILLNACLGTFGNMLKVHISFSVPRLHLDSLGALLNTLVIGREEIQYALVIFTNFVLKETQIKGFLVIVLGVSSLEHFLHSVDELG
jgi:chemotaxis protein CheC